MKRFFCLILTLALILSTLPFGGVMAAATPIYEYSFENVASKLGDWAYFGAANANTAYVTNEEAYDGNSSVYLVDTSETGAYGIGSPAINVTGGQSYTVSGYFNILSGKLTVYVKYFNGSTQVGVVSFAPSPKGGWYPGWSMVTVPANATSMRVQVVFDSTIVGEAYIDKMEVYSGEFEPEIPDVEFIAPAQQTPVDAQIVKPVDGKLQYTEYNSQGDKMSDFSYAGFYGGEYELPVTENLDVAATVQARGNQLDDTANIQAAIDTATQLYEQDGKMRVVKLKAGRYYIGSTINLRSGVVLSGEGQGPTGTVLYANNAASYVMISILGAWQNDIAADYYITDDYVKSGSRTFNLSAANAAKLSVGQKITITQPSTEAWSEALGMSGIKNNSGGDASWNGQYINNGTYYVPEFTIYTERTITAIDGTQITVDFPFYVPINTALTPTYIRAHQPTVVQATDIGVENMRFESYYNGTPTDEAHAKSAIEVKYAENVFVRDVTGKHFYYSVVDLYEGSKQITVRNCSSLEPISKMAGDRRYPFHVTGGNNKATQQILFTGCYSNDARHDYATSKTITGPIAYVDNIADSANFASETHYAWSTGVLYDNIYQVPNSSYGMIAVANRGYYGTDASHGWSAVGCVVWNSLASTIISHKPPLTYQNFAVGIWGNYTDTAASSAKAANIATYQAAYKYVGSNGQEVGPTAANFATSNNTSIVGDSYKESVAGAVNPRSLFKAQLSERFTGTINNARANAPILIDPKPDKETDENQVKISGIYQLGATKVTIYIDNVPYNAPLDPTTNKFEYIATLADGVHKIYATQTIDGYEGCKSADRFVIVNEVYDNHEYLQSVYSMDKVTMLNNDTRLTYDDYQNYEEVDFTKLAIEYTSPFSGVATAGDPITVKSQEGRLSITTPYAALATRLSTYPGYRIKEYGVVFSSSSSNATIGNCDEKVQGAIALTDFYAYGVLFHNLRLQKQYYIRPYAIYEDIKNPENAGEEYVVYGAASGYNITE
ncbi:MAG: hypothetical protein E7405_03855 [Ruminococcaceae bacterium]|nr:hypothetical protein [Oscillospiraceae bacterium]